MNAKSGYSEYLTSVSIQSHLAEIQSRFNSMSTKAAVSQ